MMGALLVGGCDASPDGVGGDAFAGSAAMDDEAPPMPPADGDDGGGESSGEPDGGSTSGGDDEDDDAFGSTGFRFDLPPDDGTDLPGLCDAVDLLFVIDNSGSMADEQQNLIASVPGFIDGIQQRLGVQTDYHVGVVSTDDATFNATGCQELGALVTRTDGDLSSASDCGPYASGRSYMTPDDDLESAFACAAQLGIDGNGIERPMDALASALNPEGSLQGCNDGFLRDDALLVIVLITDEEDEDDSAGGPGNWYENVVAAKGGLDEQIVMLSLIGHPKPNECIPGQWTGMMGAEIAPRLMGFTGIFEHGYVGDVCAGDYEPFFTEAVDHINTACTVPAG